MNKFIPSLLLVILAGGAGFWLLSLSAKDKLVEIEETIAEANLGTIDTSQDQVMSYQYYADLIDVTVGSARGNVQTNFFGTQYQLLATANGLPELNGTDFYEGWVVKNNPLDVVSTGKLIQTPDSAEMSFVNIFEIDQNITDHDYYFVTLEPDDGNIAPAKHILEGMLVKN